MLNLNINCDILQEKNMVRFNGAALELMRKRRDSTYEAYKKT